MSIAFVPASYNPLHNGHVDIINRASNIYSKVVVGIGNNIEKKYLFDISIRMQLVTEALQHLSNITIVAYEGLTVKAAELHGASLMLRGIRNANDAVYEQNIAQNNWLLNNKIETILLVAQPQWQHVSSSLVRDIYLNKGNISHLVPKSVWEYMSQSNQ